MKRVCFVVGALLLAACDSGPTVEDVCNQLDQECGVDPDDCLSDGQQVEGDADAEGCSDGFEEYLDCAEEAACEWADACAETRAELETCLGAPIE